MVPNSKNIQSLYIDLDVECVYGGISGAKKH